tara:strand:+ start:137 stop:289 length:153 start_codon:yes stop_codon:yes gene_type:complete
LNVIDKIKIKIIIDENIFKTKKLKNEYPSVNKAYDIIIVNIDKNNFIIDG